MISAKQATQVAFAGALGVAYAVLGMHTAVSAQPTVLGVVVGIVPFCALAYMAAWQVRRRALAMLGCTLVLLPLLLCLEYLRDHAAWLFFIQDVGTMTALALNFGVTLGSGHANALCSRIALMAHGKVDADHLRYTWQVTLAWAVFFGLSALTSSLLFFLASPKAWSVFAYLLTPVCIGLMFAGEYCVRLRVLPGRKHISFPGMIEAYRRYSSRQKAS